MKKVVIFGSQGHAKVVADIIEKQGDYEIIGFLDDYREVGEGVFGYSVIGGINYYKEVSDGVSTIVAVGENWGRKVVSEKIKEMKPSIEFITAIHPRSTIAKNVSVGEGTVIMAGAIINCETRIGKHCIVNTKASVGHDATLSDYATAAPNATIAGDVVLGVGAVVSMNAAVIQKKSIGDFTLIGAGSMVLSDIESYVLAYGTPAKIVRKREANESYL